MSFSEHHHPVRRTVSRRSPPETFESPLETQQRPCRVLQTHERSPKVPDVRHTSPATRTQENQQRFQKDPLTIHHNPGEQLHHLVKRCSALQTKTQKSNVSPKEPGLDLMMEHEKDSHLHSPSFLQGATKSETNSLFEERAMNQDEGHQSRRHVTLTHLEPNQAHLPAQPGPLKTRTPAHMNQPQTPHPPDLDPHQAPTPARLDPTLPVHLDPHQASLPVHLVIRQTDLHSHLDPHETPLSASLDSLQTPLLVHLGPLQIASSANLDPNQSPAHQDSHQGPSPAYPDTQISAHWDPRQAAFLASLDPHQTSATAHPDHRPPDRLEPRLTPPCVDLRIPAHVNFSETPPTAHLDVLLNTTSAQREPRLPAHVDPHPAPLPADLDPLQTPTLAHLDPHQTPAHLEPQLPAQLDSHPIPLPVHQDTHPAPLLAQLDLPQTPTPTNTDPHLTSTSAHLDPHQTHIPAAHLDSHQAHAILDPCETPPAHLNLHQTPPPAHLDPHQAPLTAQLVCHQTTAPVCLDPNQILTHAHLDSHQTLPPAHLEFRQAPLIAHPDPHPTPIPAHSNPLRCPPFAHPEPRQTPPPAHLVPHQAPPPANLDTHQPPLTAQLALHQITPPAHPNPNQTVTLAHLDLHQAALPAYPNPHQAPSTAHMDPCLTPTPAQRYPIQSPPPSPLVPRQTPPPAHLVPHQAPPPANLDTHQPPLTAQLALHQITPPAHPNPNQTVTLAHLDLHQAALPAYPNPHQAPSTAHMDPCLTPTPAQRYPIQSPPPSPLVPRQTPPPAHPHPYQTPLPVHWDSQDTPNVPGNSGEPKLCGFLLKQGGPLRAWKRRWFVYEEKQNQMFYYHTPQDVTPLGRVDLSSATFTYPLKAEMGTFHIETPERTYTLKAVTQDLMLYWLQQLQLNRWHHRQSHQTSACPDAMSNVTENFLPLLRSPVGLVGLVGQEAAKEAPRGTPLANVSIKHPFIQLQNTVHSLRKRSSQEWAQSVFSAQPPAGVRQAQATADGTASVATPPAEPVGRTAWGEATRVMLEAARRKKNRSSSTRSAAVSSETASRLQRDKDMLMEEVKAQKELVWLLHKTLEAAQREKRTCADFVAAESEQERLELLRHRERRAADLLGRAERAEAAAEAAKRDLDRRDRQMALLRDEVRKLTEKNQAKREVIIELSDHVAARVSEPARSASSTCAPDSLRQLQQCVEDLKDDIEAYKTQNRFLNSEIFQLTKLWRKSSEQERSLMVKCADLEAWRCQAESHYLGVLSKLQENASLDPEQRRSIQQMVEEALQGQAKNSTAAANGLHDEYGFQMVPDYEVEDVKLLAKIQALEIRSHNLLRQGGPERNLSSRWAQYLAGRSDDDFCPSPELKALLRAGVPPEYRQRVWRCLVRIRTGVARERQPQRYQQLCDKSRACPHPASRQIRLDLHRTLTSNRKFSSPSSPAHQQLERILLAFSWQNPSVGYCQGLNRLAAIALVVLQSEEEAFWCLVAVVDAIMPQDYYGKNLLAAQADQQVLKDFLVEKLPRLAAHFDLHGIDVSLVTFNWFLVVFVESLPSDILLPLWDAFLYEGTKVMFRYALALFKYKEDDILKIHDGVDIYQYLRFFTKTVTDARKLMGMAFVDMNPFPGRLLKNRRLLHLERVRGELRELEEQQEAFAALGTDAFRRHDDQMDNAASEDDEETG